MLVTDKISFQFEDRILIVRFLHSTLTEASEISRLTKEIVRRISPVQSAVVIDCSNLTSHVSSPFLGLLVKVSKVADESDARLVVAGLNDNLSEAIRVAKLNKYVTVFPTADAAVARFTRTRPTVSGMLRAVRQSNQKLAWSAVIGIPLLLLGALVMMIVWRPSGRADEASSHRVVDWSRFESRAVVRGHVVHSSRGVELGDQDALLVAWPVGYQAGSGKPKASEIRSPGALCFDKLFVGRVNSDGDVRVEVGFNGRSNVDFHLLLVSSHSRLTDPVQAHDLQLLSGVVADPERLFDGHEYVIRRESLRPNGLTQVEARFQRRD